MSIITRTLPDFVEVGGKKYRIHTDFRRWIELGRIMSDGAIPMSEKIVKALSLCYLRDSLPPSVEGAIYALLGFYAGTQKQPQAEKENNHRKSPVYDFEYDAEYIFAAFMAQYKIDLSETDMHWHKFRALFLGLGEDNKICKIMEYRAIDLTQIKSKEQKAFYRRMKRLYRLPDMRTEEEKEADMISALSEVF